MNFLNRSGYSNRILALNHINVKNEIRKWRAGKKRINIKDINKMLKQINDVALMAKDRPLTSS